MTAVAWLDELEDLVPLNPVDRLLILAHADLIGRTGAKAIEVAYVEDDDAEPDSARSWWAAAQHKGTKTHVEGYPDPAGALTGLVLKLIGGGECAACHRRIRPVPAGDPHVTAAKHPRLTRCVWAIVFAPEGSWWQAGCGAPRHERGTV